MYHSYRFNDKKCFFREWKYIFFQGISHEIMLLSATESSKWRRPRLVKSFVIRDLLDFGCVNLATKRWRTLFSRPANIQHTNISSAKVGEKPPSNRSIQLQKVNNLSTGRRQERLWKIANERSDVLCVIVSSLKGRAHGKAGLRTIMTPGTP